VNEIPTSEFLPFKRIRRRDPLTPFLFLVMVKDLGGLVKEGRKKKN